MKRTYYILNPVELQRRENTLKLIPILDDGTHAKAKFIPIESIDDIYVFGALDMNSALVNYLGKSGIALHFFDYYEHYTGSFMPKEYLLAGKVIIEQVKYYNSKKKRLEIAKKIIDGAATNILKNIKYYKNRGKADLEEFEIAISTLMLNIENAVDVDSLMGIEGNSRREYYKAFDLIINNHEMAGRSKQPPKNEINALVSFGNMLCYTAVLSQIYHTQLNPTISYLHQPGYRRFSLALDIAEIFKPILVDRLIFRMLNKNELKKTDFMQEVNGIKMKDSARQTFVRGWDERLKETIKHRKLNKSVSYKTLIRLELYKILKHIMSIEEYKPLKMWW